MAEKLRTDWEQVLERTGVAGYVYGACSIFHVYFETDRDRIAAASNRADLHTTDANRLKGMPPELIDQYQRYLRHHGVDIMSGTGGVLSGAHGESDIEQATDAFERTVTALRDEGLIRMLNNS